MNSYRIGVMQGRLLPKYMGRYQAHPLGYWQEEFALAKGLGLEFIEFILDHNDAEMNPLMSEEGVRQIKALSDETGVRVISICADYFMEAPLSSPSPDVSVRSVEVLRRLTQNAGRFLGVRDIVIPCVDQSSLKDDEEIERFAGKVLPLAGLAAGQRSALLSRNGPSAAPFADLLARWVRMFFTVNYDTGNSASLGYDVREEFAAYGKRITDVHSRTACVAGVGGAGDGGHGFRHLLRPSGR